MNIVKSIAALFLLSAAMPALAKDEPVSFTRDGVTYSYTETQVGKATLIKGTGEFGTPFYLIVRGNRVLGHANGVQVSFLLPAKSARGDALIVAGMH